MTHCKSIYKTITHRVLSSILTLGLVFLVTGSFAIAGIVGLIDAVLKSMLYYFHERLWIYFDKRR